MLLLSENVTYMIILYQLLVNVNNTEDNLM
jgi:hypothetical protein